MKQLFFFLAIALFTSQTLIAQLFPYRQYSSDGELVNSNVNAMMQDAEGYIWFATDNGLSRFDGSKSNNYGIENGLPVNSILSITSDERGNIYAGAKRKGIYKFSNTKFREEIIDPTSVLSNHQIIKGKDFLYSLRRMHKIAAINSTKTTVCNVLFPKEVKPLCLFKDFSGNIFAGTTKGLFKITDTSAQKIGIPELDNKMIEYLTGKGDEIFIAAGNSIYCLKDLILKQKLEIHALQPAETIQNFLVDNYNNIWFSTKNNNRVYVKTNTQTLRLDEVIKLQGAPVNYFMSDSEGNVWMATLGKGAFCFHSMYCENFNEVNGLSVPYITKLKRGTGGNDLFIGTTNGVFYFDMKNFSQLKHTTGEHEQVVEMTLTGNELNICKANTSKRNEGLTKLSNYTIRYKNASIYYVTTDGSIITGKWNNTVYRERNGKIDSILLSSTLKSNKITSIYETTEGELICGTNNGLYKIFHDNKVVKYEQSELNTVITCISADAMGQLWIGTLTGVVVLKDSEVQFTWTPGGKAVTTITSIVFDKKNRAWAGSLTGLYLISNTNDYILFSSKTCLLNDEISSLVYEAEKNVVWVGTNGGLSRIDVSRFDAFKTYTPNAIFKNIRTQDATTRIPADTTLPYNRNNFTVRFSAIHFTNPAGIKFWFRLDNANWQQATGRQVELAGLPYGKHSISIVADNDRGERGVESTISITIQTPFWATWWFKSLIGFLVLSVAFLLIRWRFVYKSRKQKEQLELQNKISELRHQALNASMNPHFIFNSLNSIQQFINTHNTEDASEYLGKFARLIRLQLNSGNQTFITLEEELDMLNRYLELEKIRFGKKLNYSIHKEEKIDTKNTYLPNMILQPFVENALWHGILPMEHAGNIKIDFSKQNGFLKVLIDDDGIGIRESERRKKDHHRSLGMQMILERIQLLKKLGGNDIVIEVSDKSEFSESLQGTRVEIRLSAQNNPALTPLA
ncbi:MAG: sensor histidine kinase [Chitinophagales bacterium]